MSKSTSRQHLTCTSGSPPSNPAVLPDVDVIHEGQADRDFLIAELDGRAEQDQSDIILHAHSVKALVEDQAVWLVLFQWEAEVSSPHYNSEIWWPKKQNRSSVDTSKREDFVL